jgi:hypothetical protein
MAIPIFRGPGRTEMLPPTRENTGEIPELPPPPEVELPPEPPVEMPGTELPGGPSPSGPPPEALSGSAAFNVGKGPLANRPTMNFADLVKGRFQQGNESGPLRLPVSGLSGGGPTGGSGGPAGAGGVANDELMAAIKSALGGSGGGRSL